MSMNIKFNHMIDLQLTPEQKDCLTIQLLQEIYRDAKEDYLVGKFNPENGIFSHPDDVALAKKRSKAAKTLLYWFMASDDYHAFLDSVKNESEYTFNPEPYMD
jgi:hypothetical protein